MENFDYENALMLGLIFLAAIIFVLLIILAIFRWIFRINERTDLLSQIKDELIKIVEKKEIEK